MLTYSELKKIPIPQEFVITPENIKDIKNPHPDRPSYHNWEESLKKIFVPVQTGANHKYVYISANEYRAMPTASCTGSFLTKQTYDAAKPALDTPAIILSKPYAYNHDHQEYLNFLLNPLISPYSFLMKPDNYKIIVDKHNNITHYVFLNHDTPGPWVGSLMILERVWSQHGSNNRFWKYWKEQDKLPFEGYFLFHHTAYLNQTDQRIGWNQPMQPYSTFDMMFNNANYPFTARGSMRTRFSAPRLFQHKPNTKAYKNLSRGKTTFLETYAIKHLNGHPNNNLLWSGIYSQDPDVNLTETYEHEISDFVKDNAFVFDRYGRIDNSKFPPGKVYSTFIKEHQNIDKNNAVIYHNAMRVELHKIIEKYMPLFYETEVA